MIPERSAASPAPLPSPPASPSSSFWSRRSLPLAWLALLSNASLLALLIPWWFWDPHLRTANLVVGLAAVLPVAATGIVGSLAELRGQGWGRIVSIVALSLALLLELSYGITRLVLVVDGRIGLAIACAVSWILTLLLLLERSLRFTVSAAAIPGASTATDPARSARP